MTTRKHTKTILRRLTLALMLAVFVATLGLTMLNPKQQQAAALSGSDWKAGRIIDDVVFNYPGSMSISQIQQFLDAKVPTCDRWGTGSYGGTTRRAYGEARGITFPLTCLKDYNENTTTKENNLEGRPTPAGAKSAAHIIWEAGQTYNVNPQVLLVLLQKEQSLIFDDWPWPRQFRSATGYGCPDTAPCDAEFYGFYNQVSNAAKQFRRYANNPNDYNFAPGGNYIQYNPNAACGGGGVYVENQATASLYNYTPYQPNAAALNNLYGSGDGCSAYGNRNFWRMYNDWFGSTTIFDPFGWSVIRTANDGRQFLVVGNTKRWIPSGDIFNDWKLSAKPLEIVSQQYFDSIPTLPQLDRLGFYNNQYFYVAGGKKYNLSNDALLRAWGQYNVRHLAVPAYIPLSSVPDGGEAPFFASNGSETSRVVDGVRYAINASDADRWRANPINIGTAAYHAIPQAGSVDYRINIEGTKFIVDNGRAINITNPSVLRDFGQSEATFVPMPAAVLNIMAPYTGKQLIRSAGSPLWYQLINGQKYYVPNGANAAAWGVTGEPITLSDKLSAAYSNSGISVPVVVREAESGKIFLLDGAKHETTGAMLNAVQSPSKTIPSLPSAALSGLVTGQAVSSPIVQWLGTPHVYTMANGDLYHVPGGNELNGLGYPRKYGISQLGSSLFNVMGSAGGANMFIKSGGTTYFLQDGNAFPIASGATSNWLGGKTALDYISSNFTSRFDVSGTQLGLRVRDRGSNLVISGGQAVDVSPFNDAYDGGTNWTNIVTFGMPRSPQPASFLARSSNGSDTRVWLMSNGTKQHVITSGQFLAYSSGGRLPVLTLSPEALNEFSQVGAGVDLSVLIQKSGSGVKALETDGSFYGFPDGTTVTNYIGSNVVQGVSASVFDHFNAYRGNITRLLRTPNGTMYWVEGGAKRWLTSGNAVNQYNGTPTTNVNYGITNWLPNGQAIN